MENEILEYLNSANHSQWSDLREMLKKFQDLSLDDIRSSLTKMVNYNYIEFKSDWYSKLGIPNRLNSGDEKNTLITLDNAPDISAKIKPEGSAKFKADKLTADTAELLKKQIEDFPNSVKNRQDVFKWQKISIIVGVVGTILGFLIGFLTRNCK